MDCVHNRDSFLQLHRRVPCESGFPVNSFCLHACPSALWSSLFVFSSLLHYAQVFVCPFYPRLRDNEAMVGIGFLCSAPFPLSSKADSPPQNTRNCVYSHVVISFRKSCLLTCHSVPDFRVLERTWIP